MKLRRLNRRTLTVLILLIPGLIVVLLVAGWWLLRHTAYSPTSRLLDDYLTQPDQQSALISNMQTPCPNAPFLLPTRGFVGFLYSDPTAPYTPFNAHTGVDIFGNGTPGTIPVYAAYDGYLTRLSSWISAVIIRIPHDPLEPSRQIWNYYAHMADLSGTQSFISADFPPGTSEVFVKQGTLLGYQGIYAGPDAAPIAMHLHFSIVLSDTDGSFRNETRIQNTLDPSPYFGLTLNAGKNPTIPVRCAS